LRSKDLAAGSLTPSSPRSVVNKLGRSRLPSLSSARRTLTSSSRYSTLRSRLAFIPLRRRALALVTLTLIFLYLLLSPSDDTVPLTPTSRLRTRRGHTAQAALAVLTSSTLSSVLKPGYPAPQNKAKVIESVSNPFGFIGLIDPYAGGIFNPSVLVLPDAAGLGWRHLYVALSLLSPLCGSARRARADSGYLYRFVARGEEKYELIAGEDTRWESVVGCALTSSLSLSLAPLPRERSLTFLLLAQVLPLAPQARTPRPALPRARVGPHDARPPRRAQGAVPALRKSRL